MLEMGRKRQDSVQVRGQAEQWRGDGAPVVVHILEEESNKRI